MSAVISTALLTDHYELTMVQAALRSGAAHRRSVFELFGRRLPEGRRYGVVAGTGRLLNALQNFRFGDEELSFLRENKVVDADTLEFLANFRFSGDIWGYPEGEVFFPGSPLLIVESTFAEAVLLETVALSIYNFDCAVAGAASRMATAAGSRPLIEMGARRTHEQAAVAASRAAYICGFNTTSDLEAGRRHGIPTAGTSAHSFALLHDSEEEAFAAQVASMGKGTTLLVDTYDVRRAVETAVRIAGPELGGVRIDSGDLVTQAREVRAQLDELGATQTRIVVTSDLDEYAIAALAAAPVDVYGVGTQLVTGSGAPTAGLVYKLVAHENSTGTMVNVAKRSVAKDSVGGRKVAARRLGADGIAEAEVIGIGEAPAMGSNDRLLLVPLVQQGQIVAQDDPHAARQRRLAALAELPSKALRLSKGSPVIPTMWVEGDQTVRIVGDIPG
ncbi:Nicotinate phosphoribosyltransferase [Dermatophilus congolensis]|uniref:Nicotinate phosphoribosyltransferase n=2 Tax=Dermatophilus congolensis TaxID=1863 RepID=A0A239VIW9_9MICO|nr:nicotinate phosphoribosyltransferase [Dermatophilus congolensis]SNV21836.1 Nicotinate phosphoribosyltransferase [Dermatophilus congolensis]